jgi:hypothetical protein
MATKLDKAVIRESTIMVDDRNIIVSINEDQTISMKLKGMKSGMVSINIEELYKTLAGDVSSKPKKEPADGALTITAESILPVSGSEPIINLNHFRSQYLISADIPLDIKVKLEAITVQLIEPFKKKRN